jgi:transcriptional regulator with PAS, ATPase and Fis domain
MRYKILLAWIGNTDLRVSRGEESNSLGPIGQAVTEGDYSHIYLLSDHKEKEDKNYLSWLGKISKAIIKVRHVRLTTPTNFGEIYENAIATIESIKHELKKQDLIFTYHLSPGTPAMAAVWILLAKTSYPAELIESSQEHGVKTVSFPFEISADYLPELLRKTDKELVLLAQGLPPASPEFNDIIHRCDIMQRLITRAQRIANHDVPVLILGESGTGKELFARAIHKSSPRREKPFTAVNCGAIPSDLFEAEFFGYEKGAFTGAASNRIGYLETANEGTLFLDEIGELSPPSQVKLLRAIQEGLMQKLGSTKTIKINIRIVAATNRNLLQEVAAGNFREDLFHRLAVGVLQMPSLRERKSDLNILIDHILDKINRERAGHPGWTHKKLSAGARNLLQQHSWPGNIRELINTLSRVAIWVPGETIQTEDVKEAIFPVTPKKGLQQDLLNQSLGDGFILNDLLSEVARHYLKRAITEAKNNKSLAAKLTGLQNYQTFSNWMKKYDIDF